MQVGNGVVRIAIASWAATVFGFASPAYAVVVWDESGLGDLSNVASEPTDLKLLIPGSNHVLGSITRGGVTGSDSDDFARFAVPHGYVLARVLLQSYDDGNSPDYAPFALYRGDSNSGPLIEGILLSESNAGTDLLQFDSAPGPQPAGGYNFHFAFTSAIDSAPSFYTLDLQVAAIPEPAAATLALVGIGLVGFAVKMRRKSEQPSPVLRGAT